MALVTNNKATYNYEILEKCEGGIELFGYEVKAIRNKQGKLDGSYVKFIGNEAFISGSDIPPYQTANTPIDYNRTRNRKILLSKKEILRLKQKCEADRLTLVPLALYNKGRVLKVELALAKGKKKYDKRETIKRRETDIEMRRTLKGE
jgi:SsrA-binding protein